MRFRKLCIISVAFLFLLTAFLLLAANSDSTWNSIFRPGIDAAAEYDKLKSEDERFTAGVSRPEAEGGKHKAEESKLSAEDGQSEVKNDRSGKEGGRFAEENDLLKKEDGRPENKNKKINVVTSIFPVYINTLNVVRDINTVSVTNLVPATEDDVHKYRLTSRDLEVLEEADVLIINGAGVETFIEDVRNLFPDLEILDLNKDIAFPKDEDRVSRHYTWLDISNTIVQLQKITQFFCSIDPENEEQFKINEGDYYVRLEMMLDRYMQVGELISNNNIAVMHGGLEYIAQNAGLNVVYSVEEELGENPSTEELKDAAVIIKERGAQVLLVDSSQRSEDLNAVALETGIELCYIDTFVDGKNEEPMSYSVYIHAMRENLNALRGALLS